MFFDLSKPQLLLRQSVRDFCKREFAPERVRDLMQSDSACDSQLWRQMADQGWIGLHLEEQHGGLGLGLVDLAVVAEELGRACVPGPWLTTNWAAMLLSESEVLVQKYLADLIEGRVQATVAVLEEESTWRIEPGSLRTELSQDGCALNGQKELVMQASTAQLIVCLVRNADQLALVALPTDAPGVSVSATPGIDETRKLSRCTFSDVRIEPWQCLATGTEAARIWSQATLCCSVIVSAEMLGLMQWMLETTTEYAKARKQFDQPIGAFQSVQHKCAEMLLLAESSRSAIWYAAWAVQEKTDDAPRAVSIAKAFASDAVRTIGNLAVQAHGGVGFTWEHDLHIYYKRAKADEYLFGDATHHRENVAQLLLG